MYMTIGMVAAEWAEEGARFTALQVAPTYLSSAHFAGTGCWPLFVQAHAQTRTHKHIMFVRRVDAAYCTKNVFHATDNFTRIPTVKQICAQPTRRLTQLCAPGDISYLASVCVCVCVRVCLYDLLCRIGGGGSRATPAPHSVACHHPNNNVPRRPPPTQPTNVCTYRNCVVHCILTKIL